jgi:hypothetical protein
MAFGVFVVFDISQSRKSQKTRRKTIHWRFGKKLRTYLGL